MKIQVIKISENSVEIMLADASSKEDAKQWVHFSMNLTVPASKQIAECYVEVLQKLQKITSAEILRMSRGNYHNLYEQIQDY